MAFLLISIRFLGSSYHGCWDRGEPEWPPSPLRLFQALVAAATNGGGCALPAEVDGALRWLERRLPPTIVVPATVHGTGYRLSVPNNAMDIVARAWSRGTHSTSGDASPATHRTMKTVRPTYVDDRSPVHFLWKTDADAPTEIRVIARLARRMVALGWGTDLVVADGAVMSDAEASALDGAKWTPRPGDAGAGLRVPVSGTLDDVLHRHRRFLARLESDHFDAPPPLATYATVAYHPETVHVPQPSAVFSLLNVGGTGFRAFDTATRALTVAGMTRHAARTAADRSRWPAATINQLVLGHAEQHGDSHRPAELRFAYVPLPSIEPRGRGEVVGSVRRVMITIFGGAHAGEISWAKRALPGRALISEKGGQQAALLGTLPIGDAVTARYVHSSSTWTSVTPVVLPGYDDPGHFRRRLVRSVSASEQKNLLWKLEKRTDGLIRKAILQAGFAAELAEHARIEWRRAGFWAGSELADRYGVPDHLKRFTRVHVRLEWLDRFGRPLQVAGPCVLGGGRFYGLDVLAT